MNKPTGKPTPAAAPLVNIRQNFRPIRLSYFSHGNSITVQHLPYEAGTLIDFVQCWPLVAQWLRADKCRSISVDFHNKTHTSIAYCEINHINDDVETAIDMFPFTAGRKI